MYSLKNDGVLIQVIDNLLTHATSYYKTLFGYGEGDKMSLDPMIWTVEEKLSEEDNQIHAVL
jgi:hypothetical protein